MILWKNIECKSKKVRSVATGSLRRKFQWKLEYPNDKVVPIRGNIPSRIKKLNTDPKIDGVFFASAALSRLEIFKTLGLPLSLIFLVLGSIIAGVATPTEASALGAIGALIIAALNKKIDIDFIKETSQRTAIVSTMIFAILIGASIFSLIFRGIGGDELIDLIFGSLPGGPYVALLFVLFLVFLLGFILDFIEICYVIVPLVAPPLLMMGFDPVWLAILLAINLQTSFLTPPFGFSLFYLRGVADESIKTSEIYKGVIPFIAIQLLVLSLVLIFPWFII